MHSLIGYDVIAPSFVAFVNLLCFFLIIIEMWFHCEYHFLLTAPSTWRSLIGRSSPEGVSTIYFKHTQKKHCKKYSIQIM